MSLNQILRSYERTGRLIDWTQIAAAVVFVLMDIAYVPLGVLVAFHPSRWPLLLAPVAVATVTIGGAALIQRRAVLRHEQLCRDHSA